MILFLIIAAIAVTTSNSLPSRDDGCTVSINEDLSDPQPLILLAKGSGLDFVNPIDNTSTLSFAKNEGFRLACTGEGNYLVDVGENDIQDIEAYCVGGKTFLVKSVEYEFSNLTCNFLPESVARPMKDNCLDGKALFEIGFQVSESEFLRTIEICRDDETFTTYYTKFKLTKAIGGYQRDYPDPDWIQGDFYSTYNLTSQYARLVQRATLSVIVNSTELGRFYVSTRTKYFFSVGHLVAKADFVYGAAHHSTFWYLNSAPQWQSFNAGNWKDLEQDVRNYASTEQLDLEVYTGVHGILSLADLNGIEHSIFLYASGEERALSVPKFFWKIIYDPLTQRGTAFVGVNNLYLSMHQMIDNFICDDISAKISWLNWIADEDLWGLSYACTVDDLAKVVTTLPPLIVTDILT